MIIGVTGSPGTGKSTFAVELAVRLGYKVFNVEDFIVKNGLYIGFDVERGSYILDIDKAVKRFNEVLSDGYIYEGLSLAYLVSERFDYVIVLRCNPYVLEDRLVRKGFDRGKILENIQAEILDIVLSEVLNRVSREKVIQIDNSYNLEIGVEKVLNILNGMGGSGDSVDWLGLINKKGDLNRFFPV